jgi:hypothetical protein
LRYRKTKQLVDDNEQAARIALYLPQLHAQKEKLEADLQGLEHLALSGWGRAALLCTYLTARREEMYIRQAEA